MANKRMLSNKITESDAFLEMPMSAQCLYFHLCMNADDDGFLGGIKRIMRMLGAAEDDFKILVGKRFLLDFGNGVVVIKHWRIHNTISQNRYHETVYLDEKAMLYLKDDKSYSFDEGTPLLECGLQTACKRLTSGLQTADSGLGLDIDLDLEKKRKSKREKDTKRERFVKPTLEQIEAYKQEQHLNINSQKFFNYYESVGWIVKTKPMKDWKAAMRYWHDNEGPRNASRANFTQRTDDLDALVAGRMARHGPKEEVDTC